MWKTGGKNDIFEKEQTMTRYAVFTNVETFYSDLVCALNSAERKISLMYFTFDDGKWAREIASALGARASAGVEVRLMVDQLGLLIDHPGNIISNRLLLNDLRAMGVHVIMFNPKGHRLWLDNRLHAKICAVDDRIAFIGGSNIGDYYSKWDDINLLIEGKLGRSLHNVYDFFRCHSKGSGCSAFPEMHLSRLFAGSAQIWLTVPKQRRDIHRAFLKIILDAETDIFIRNWYFLPDHEILDALRSQAERGVNVHVLMSDKTRVRPIDYANLIAGHKLAKSGGRVLRYTGKYMHAKVAWNDHGEVLFGSANMDRKALRGNFECSLSFVDRNITLQLKDAFEQDACSSMVQDENHFRRGSIFTKALAYTCNLASAWL